MNPEAVVLSQRLVALGVDTTGLHELITPEGHAFRTTHPPAAIRLGDFPDLDHPSNEGHLRRLAEEVLGRPVGVKFIRGGCRVEIINPSPDAWKTVHPTPGQAYAAAIVAHYEGERA